MTITGTELHKGATVMFGTTAVGSRSDHRTASTSLFVETPAHTAGVIDVTVVNIDGQMFRISQGYEYVSQQSFDFNGNWEGWTTNGTDTLVQLTIRNNVLVTASCLGDQNKTVKLTTDVVNGDFSLGRSDGFVLSGRIVSESQAVGQITAPPCIGNANPWHLSKVASLFEGWTTFEGRQ